MSILTHGALSESRSVRASLLGDRTDEFASDSLSRAKAIVFAVWQGTGLATTQQVAEYYEVAERTVKNLIERNELEFVDEVRKLAGKELKDARLNLSLASKTSQVLVWTPRGVLRVGLMLTESEVARNVRDVVIDIAETSHKRIQELEEENRRLREENDPAAKKKKAEAFLREEAEAWLKRFPDKYFVEAYRIIGQVPPIPLHQPNWDIKRFTETLYKKAFPVCWYST